MPIAGAANNNNLNYDDGNTSSDDEDNAFGSRKRLTLMVVNADIDLSPSSSDDEDKIPKNHDPHLMKSNMQSSSSTAPQTFDSSICSNETHPDYHASQGSPPPTPLHNDDHLSDIQQPIHHALNSNHSSSRNSLSADHLQQQPHTSDTSEMGSLKCQVEADERLTCTPPPVPPSMTTDARSMISTTNESVLVSNMHIIKCSICSQVN